MNSPTPYLDLLILLASVNPSGFSFSIRSIFSKKENETIDIVSLMYLGLPFLILIPLIPLLKKSLYFLTFPAAIFYLLAFFLVPVCILLEYYLNMIYFYITTGRRHKGITLHSAWKTNRSVISLLLTVFIAVGEELIFRQCWFYLLGKTFSLPVAVIIFITSALYGMNHFHYGMSTVLAKFGSGAIYGILYVAGGYSILLPISTHVLQNLGLILLAGRENA
ncbi:MAG TPA: CPBP family intramembrane glutamic endopeptidase [Candidatus Deferrimicrobium sp.]|nr:CPBP family intramembrane glutamic endopeptidase [Candidatus Deferrimicrobium sp.]